MMSADVVFEDGDYGLRAVLLSRWSDAVASRLRHSRISEIELNDAKGWRGNDLFFLASFPNLLAFKIIDFSITSVQPIHLLHNLRSLDVITYRRTELRFEMFPDLEKCGLEWRAKATSLFSHKSFVDLYINRYDGRDLEAFAQLINLEKLALLNASIETIAGLTALNKLKSLRLGNLTKLTSLDGLGRLRELEELDIQRCKKIGSIDVVAQLSKLRTLDLNDDGDIASLKPLEQLNFLERVTFYESTNIVDGDLTPLMSRKALSRVSFKNRRHYSHRREEFGKASIA